MLLRKLAPGGAIALAAVFAACGSAVSTSAFKGEQQRVAKAIADLTSDITAGEEKKVCENDLAAAVVKRLGGGARCRTAVKQQISEIDNLDVTVQSVALGAGGKTATAGVKSTYGGKKHTRSVQLVREAGKWKISAIA